MGGIIDLTDDADHEILTSTASDGLFGGSYLSGEPLGSYLEADEEPKYVLRNKKSGLDIDRGETTKSLDPDENYQILALVTDTRILFVAGGERGDNSESLQLMDVVEARVESGLRTSTLAIETLANEIWRFPCRGNPSPVATFIEETAQSWANAARLLDDLEESLFSAEEHLAAGDHEAAKSALDGGRSTIEMAVSRMDEVGTGASKQIRARASELAELLVDLERERTARAGADAHSTAQERWQHDEYEAAARAYESAIDTYRQALEIGGSNPTDAALTARIRGVASERELLRVAPLVEADTRRRRAVALADPEEAAIEWEAAHEAYRELLGLEWAQPERQFVADRDLVREQTVEIVDDAIDDHHEAGRRWLTAGDKLAVQSRPQQAEQVYERARDQFKRAHSLATELRPERVDSIASGIEAAKQRLEGEVPEHRVPTDPVAFDPSEQSSPEETDSNETVETQPSDAEGIEGLSFHDSQAPDSVSGGPLGQTPDHTAESTTRKTRPGRTSSTSVLERIQAQKQTAIGSNDTDPESKTATNARDGAIATREDEPESAESTDGEHRPATDPAKSPEGESAKRPDGPQEIETTLRSLDRKALTAVIDTLWEAEGWVTTVIEGTTKAVYDVVAVRKESGERILLWVEPCLADDEVSKKTIEQCATTLESSQSADRAVLVTLGTLSPPASNLAADRAVEVVTGSELVERIQSADISPTQTGGKRA